METLAVFAKTPHAEAIKTRLAKTIGEEKARALHLAFVQDTLATCVRWKEEKIAADPNRRVVVYSSDKEGMSELESLLPDEQFQVFEQAEGDLGTRLQAAFDAEFDRGGRAVCIIGTDAPNLPKHLLDHAFRALAWEKVTLGPAFDGGYWLVGAQRVTPDIFREIPWSTDAVLEQTLAKMQAQDLTCHLLPFWYDVDEDADLKRLITHLRFERRERPERCAHTWAALESLDLLSGEGA
jgi:rSAM/selenodomain-associated transferase 1